MLSFVLFDVLKKIMKKETESYQMFESKVNRIESLHVYSS